MYQGTYGDKQYHEPDLAAVLERSWAAGVERIIVTGGTLEGSRAALALARTDSTPQQQAQRPLLGSIILAGRTLERFGYAQALARSDRTPLASSPALPTRDFFTQHLPLLRTSNTLDSSPALATSKGWACRLAALLQVSL